MFFLAHIEKSILREQYKKEQRNGNATKVALIAHPWRKKHILAFSIHLLYRPWNSFLSAFWNTYSWLSPNRNIKCVPKGKNKLIGAQSINYILKAKIDAYGCLLKILAFVPHKINFMKQESTLTLKYLYIWQQPVFSFLTSSYHQNSFVQTAEVLQAPVKEQISIISY